MGEIVSGYSIVDFVRESNRIEGIYREPTEAEIDAHLALCGLESPTIPALCCFVSVVQPGAELRARRGMNVRVGSHVAPCGGATLKAALGLIFTEMLHRILMNKDSRERIAYQIHQKYETLHPFTDGNGRSGRALWLWCMGGIRNAPLGFLHHWYYQSLQFGRESQP